MRDERTRGPFWITLAIPVTILTVLVLLGHIEAHGLARVGWTMLLIVMSAGLWLLQWFDKR